MDDAVRAWRESGKHLPPFLRDFHDQKAVFKTLHWLTRVTENEVARKVDWITGHVYVIDFFLWFMARHGYTLQRSRAKLNFDSLEKHMALREKKETEAFRAMLDQRSSAKGGG